jgi:uncharacterized membrane protein YfcA
MTLGAGDYVAVAAAAVAAGAVNAVAGGGTLITFPTLVALGVPPVSANVTNTVSLCPGYLAGSHAQRDDLRTQRDRLRRLTLVAAAGGLSGSILLIVIPAEAFRAAIPWLILLSCVLLAGQNRVRAWARPAGPATVTTRAQAVTPLLGLTTFAAAVYGGFFGAGLGIMLLAVLGLFLDDTLVRLNALKQALSLLINVVAAVFFAFSGHVVWSVVPVMAVAALVGGALGGRLSRVIDADLLRNVVIVAGMAIAVSFWVD